MTPKGLSEDERAKAWFKTFNDRATLFNRVIDGLSDHTDREMAIVASALIEDHLKDYILSRMVSSVNQKDIFRNFGPLATFSARITIAHAFNFIPETIKNDLNCIRDARNRFAHYLHVDSFDDKVVRKFCAKMKTISVEAYSDIDKVEKSKFIRKNNIRNRYLFRKKIGIAITDDNDGVIFWVSSFGDNLEDSRDVFLNCVKSCYMYIAQSMIERYLELLSDSN